MAVSARRASDTTLAKVASRTSVSHMAVRAPTRVERARCWASHATSSNALARSNGAGLPAPVDHLDRTEQPHQQLPRRLHERLVA